MTLTCQADISCIVELMCRVNGNVLLISGQAAYVRSSSARQVLSCESSSGLYAMSGKLKTIDTDRRA